MFKMFLVPHVSVQKKILTNSFNRISVLYMYIRSPCRITNVTSHVTYIIKGFD